MQNPTDLPSPPPLPLDEKPAFAYRAAKYAVTVLVVSIGLNLLVQLSLPSGSDMAPVGRVLSIICGVLFLSAIPAAIIALCGIPKYGRRYLLWRGLVGILVPVLLMAMAVPAFLKVRSLAGDLVFKNIAMSINQDAPKMIDDVTRIEKAVAGPGKLLTIHITITSIKAADLDMDVWKNQVRPKLKAGILASPIVQNLRNGGTITYVYSGSDGAKLDEISITSADLPTKPKS